MGRQKTKLQYVALLFRLWVDTLPSPLKLGASRLRCFRLRPDVCAKTFSHDYIARLKAGSEISVHKQLISQLSPAIESKSVFTSERGLTSMQWTEYSEHTKRVQIQYGTHQRHHCQGRDGGWRCACAEGYVTWGAYYFFACYILQRAGVMLVR